jgi:hypothetical protein
VNAIRNKIPLVSNFVSENNLDVLCLSETKVDPSISILSIPGYVLYRKDRTNNGGGVAILIKDEFTHHGLTFDAVESNLVNTEVLSIKIQVLEFKSILVTCLYRAKFNLSYNDTRQLEYFLNELDSTGLTFYCCGDYNIHLEEETKPEVIRFNNMLARHSFKELINAPTRGPARLDLIITNDSCIDNIDTLVLSHSISDHDSVIITKQLKVQSRPSARISFRDYKSINWEDLGHSVIDSFKDFDSDLSVNEFTQDFITRHTNIFDELAPILTKTIRVPRIPKIASDRSRQLIKFRNNLQRSFRNGNNTVGNQIRAMNRVIKRSINEDTKCHLDSEIDRFGIWKVKSRLFQKTDDSKLPFTVDEINDFYSSISNEPVTSSCPPKPSSINFDCIFSFKPIDKKALISAYRGMKNRSKTAPDITGFSPIMLSNTILCPSVTDSLQNLVSNSLEFGVFPDILKKSVITAIPKIRNPKSLSDLRPISVQPFLGLRIEKCAKAQLMDHLNQDNILFKGQFGFRPSHSCESAMIALTEFLYRQINAGNICVLVSLDLAKAFDLIVREFLLEKLGWYGIDRK